MADKQTNWTGPIVALVTVALTFVAVVVGFIGWKVNLWPWQMAWLDGSNLDPLVIAIMLEQQVEIAIIALVALGSLMLWVASCVRRPGVQGSEQDRGIDPDLADAVDEDGVGVTDDAEVMEVVQAPPRSAANGTAKNAGQLQIATAELGRMRKELVSCRQQLEQATQAKTQFLANMSHELRTPMNGIMGMTELLLSSALEPREKRFVTSIGASAEALLGIINDLLDFSKIETGTLYLDRSRFRVRDCVEDICSTLAQSAHVKGIELICYIDDDVPEQADGDANRLRQILKNLLSNAIAFTSEGEVVCRLTHVETSERHHTLKCDVQDSGAGIAPELQATLFNAFTQADSSTTRRHGGLGMGLAITQQLVKMMKGDITFRSRLGEGTRFTFTMQFDEARDVDGEVQQRRDLKGSRVLVVDDNETNRTILYHQLSNWGVHADTVEDGPGALSYLRRTQADGHPYDVLILDLHMPGMDGIELARAIAADPDIGDIRSLMLTSAVLDLDGTALSEIGIDKYISKPARQSLLHDSLVSLMPHVAQSVPTESAPTTPPSVVKVGAHVLLAEDNVVNQDVASSMLEALGCTVETAADGRSAVELAAVQAFDVIFMDCQMPHMDGFEATRQIRRAGSMNAKTPIVALTANALEGDRERCLTFGMDDYVSKPVRQEQISDLLIKWAKSLVVLDVESASDKAAEDAATAEMHDEAHAGPDPEARDNSTTAIDAGSAADTTPDTTPDSGANTGAATGAEADTDTTPDLTPDNGSDTGSDTGSDSGQDTTADAAASDDQAAVAADAAINVEAIDSIRGMQGSGKTDLLARVVSMYTVKSPELIEQMRVAADAADFDAVKAGAHSLKSSSAYLGAEDLARCCDAVETAADAGDQARTAQSVEAVNDAYARAAEALNGYVQAA